MSLETDMLAQWQAKQAKPASAPMGRVMVQRARKRKTVADMNMDVVMSGRATAWDYLHTQSDLIRAIEHDELPAGYRSVESPRTVAELEAGTKLVNHRYERGLLVADKVPYNLTARIAAKLQRHRAHAAMAETEERARAESQRAAIEARKDRIEGTPWLTIIRFGLSRSADGRIRYGLLKGPTLWRPKV